jgi:hypothetical protein
MSREEAYCKTNESYRAGFTLMVAFPPPRI